ncbi:MAG: 50S ribosomal protein L32 [Deltaproteobacteria bacterium]|nr:50S ribosomal protein L32 [Deltaproteobacteria bacterium]
MAVPRKRKSHSRRRQQRSHDALQRPALNKCPNCGAPRLPHRVCGACGWYNDRTVVEVDAD